METHTFEQHIQPLIQQYCYSCHGEEKTKGDVDLTPFKTSQQVFEDRDLWLYVLEQIETEEMPTKDPLPTTEERALMVEWIDARLNDIDWSKVREAGHVTIPRLNKTEYQNTMRDLLGIETNAGSTLSKDGEGQSGFTTDRSNLFITASEMEKYFNEADRALEAVIALEAEPTSVHFESEDMFMTESDKVKTIRGLTGYEINRGQMTLYESVEFPHDGYYTFRLKAVPSVVPFGGLRLRVDDEVKGDYLFKGEEPTTESLTLFMQKGTHQVAFNFESSILPGNLASQYKREKKVGSTLIDWVKIDGPVRPESSSTQSLVFFVKPSSSISEDAAAHQIIERFAQRAFRRPLQANDAARYLSLYQRAAKGGENFASSIKLALTAILVSPNFLFRHELAPENNSSETPHLTEASEMERTLSIYENSIQQSDFLSPGVKGSLSSILNSFREELVPYNYPGGEFALNDFQIASRLSYFLWMSMPDHELFALAREGKLRDPEILRAQVRRMVVDPKARSFTSAFLGEWLGYQSVGESVIPDAKTFPQFDGALARAMKDETILTFEHLIKNNHKLLHLIDTNATFINERLAKHYQIDGITGPEMRPMAIRDRNRGGLLGMASVLTATSSPTRTSPVLRGKWVLETLLGEHIPEPPPDAGELSADAGRNNGTTLREELEIHRNNPDCRSCHEKIDPIGFGLENFDAIGRFRVKENGKKIDSSGIVEGHEFSGIAQLKSWLVAERKEAFLDNLSKRMLAFALGRELETYDQAALLQIKAKLQANDYGALTLIEEIVLSYPFLHQNNSKPELANL